ncbi:MAG: bifunctional phosphopantothenoylcysteine decarboxylase/phosphopantothenate--cysteine ligase CoaBC [Candidatus Dormibacteraeota bacterium]|nr:bifunctional phosphopantothenoylcysteine decarboxylase/phosphopantothenate--cysteine ligase CoaBC [Candidatus Dormibacteraeota bacterium]
MSPLDAAPVPERMRGRRVAVLVTGGIAAYKIADLVSLMTQAGVQVRVAMTAAATTFVGPLTFEGLCGRPVLTDLWQPGPVPEPHVELGDWAEAALVAPATANTLALLAQGRGDDVALATVLAARCPVVVAPAMNDAMWGKPAVQENVTRLRAQGITIVGPEPGRLASGHSGAGRLVANAVLVEALDRVLSRRADLAGRRVVVSAGGTREPIDPVRFVGNRSSGKMGAALAEAAADRGAQVTLVTTGVRSGAPGIEVRAVETSQEMLEALREATPGADLLLMAAAVADFRPVQAAGEKLHREGRSRLVLELEAGPDLLWELRQHPGTERTVRLGFAAEDRDLEEHAEAKLRRKGLDAIFVNDILRRDIAFGADQNAGTLLLSGGRRVQLDRMPKLELAHRLLDEMLPLLRPSPAG